MNKRTIALSFSVLMLATFAIHAGEIYRSTDAKGNPVYSDHPLSDTAQRMVIRTERTDPEAVEARIADERKMLEQAVTTRKDKTEKDQMARAEKEKAESSRKESCQRAQSRVRTLANERQVYRFDEQGNRVYPSVEELAAQRESARQEVEQNCE